MMKLRRIILTMIMIVFNTYFIASVCLIGFQNTIKMFVDIALGLAIILIMIIGNMAIIMNWKQALKEKQREGILHDHLKKL